MLALKHGCIEVLNGNVLGHRFLLWWVLAYTVGLNVFDRFWMRCCWDRRYKHSNCRTVRVQSHGKVLNYKVPPNYVMTGVGQSDSRLVNFKPPY